MGYKWVNVTGDGGKTSFKISQGNGRIYAYNRSGSSIGETRSVEDAISLIKSTYGKKVWSVDIGEENISCFSADSLILTPTGYKPISEMHRGDKVTSVRVSRLQQEIGIVTNRVDHPISRIWEVRTTLSATTVCTTGSHPFLTTQGWILSRNLHVGDQLISVCPSTTHKVGVVSVVPTDRFEPVHNIVTTGSHNFIVQGLSVHNFAFARGIRTFWHQIFVAPWLMHESGLLGRSRSSFSPLT